MLDDDPTGSQTVHGVSVVFDLDPRQYARALADPGSTGFVLTNSRSLPEADAETLTGRVGRDLAELEQRLGGPISIVSRSDSTLRGHLVAEVRALHRARRQVTGRGYDGVLFVPAYLEAGRVTAGDTHWALVHGQRVPVGRTEFAADPVFGYTASDLRDYLVEKTAGRVRRDEVHSLSLDDIRSGGPARVTQLLAGVDSGRFVVVNATEYADLEIVVLGVLEAQAAGQTFLHRSGPSFVRALAGIAPHPPLTSEQIWPCGRPDGHGLVVVGSHVGLTNRQIAALRIEGQFAEVLVEVPALIDPSRRERHIAEVTDRVISELAAADVLLVTSRHVESGSDGGDALQISRTVSAAVARIVAGTLEAGPDWIVAKGGITSHDVAVAGLGIRRAVVVGQFLPGLVSLLRPVESRAAAVGVPFVVFAGNVGDEHTLADVVRRVRGR